MRQEGLKTTIGCASFKPFMFNKDDIDPDYKGRPGRRAKVSFDTLDPSLHALSSFSIQVTTGQRGRPRLSHTKAADLRKLAKKGRPRLDKSKFTPYTITTKGSSLLQPLNIFGDSYYGISGKYIYSDTTNTDNHPDDKEPAEDYENGRPTKRLRSGRKL